MNGLNPLGSLEMVLSDWFSRSKPAAMSCPVLSALEQRAEDQKSEAKALSSAKVTSASKKSVNDMMRLFKKMEPYILEAYPEKKFPVGNLLNKWEDYRFYNDIFELMVRLQAGEFNCPQMFETMGWDDQFDYAANAFCDDRGDYIQDEGKIDSMLIRLDSTLCEVKLADYAARARKLYNESRLQIMGASQLPANAQAI